MAWYIETGAIVAIVKNNGNGSMGGNDDPVML